MNEETQESWTASEGALENGLPCFIRIRQDLPDEDEIKNSAR